MFLKKSVSVLTVLAAGTLILFNSCKKNDDVSSSSGMPENQSQMTSATTNSFTITAQDGHFIGINGVNPTVNTKGGQNVINSCGGATNLTIQAVCSNGTGFLYNAWTSGGGAVIALYINGQQYKDPSTGYGLFLSGLNGLSVQISGGISAGQTYRDFIRTYCSNDTTNSSYYDSPVTTYIVPSTFLCGGGTSTGGGTTRKGHRK